MRRSSVQIRPVALLAAPLRPRRPAGRRTGGATHAGVAQLVERNLAKVEVAGSNPVTRFFVSRLADPPRRARPPRPHARTSHHHITLGAWLSPVERCVRDAEVPGSNPGAPTLPAWSSWPGVLLSGPGHPSRPPRLGGPPKAVVAKSGRPGPVNQRHFFPFADRASGRGRLARRRRQFEIAKRASETMVS